MPAAERASRVAGEQSMQARRYTLSDFDYAIPPELIAQAPAPTRLHWPERKARSLAT